MTFEEFNKLPVGTKINFCGIILEKKCDGYYKNPQTIIKINESEYEVMEYHNTIISDTSLMTRIIIVSIPNSTQSLKEKIQKLSQEIDSKSEEKYKLEMELENLLRTERENILKNLIPGEWYKIQHVRGSFNTVKFIDIRHNLSGEVIHGEQISIIPFFIILSDVKTIEHINGAKEAEEKFRKMLEG